jgi:APA family basic amino acid/polyamine antiporter
MSASSTSSSSSQPQRHLGLSASFTIVAGSMLGIGIFLAPTTMALHLNLTLMFVGVWIFTGLVSLSGATTYAELGVLFPKSGGDYHFHREALGPSVAFAYGWGLLGAGFAGSIAAMSVPFCTFQLSFLLGVPFDGIWITLPLIGEVNQAQGWALLLILIFTLINIYGVKLSTWIQGLTTYIPLILLFILSIITFTQDPNTFVDSSKVITASSDVPSWSLSGLTTAFLEAYFAYSGWNAIIYVAGEVKRPSKTIPLALIGGTIIVMGLYLLLSGAALHFLDFEGLRSLAQKHQDIGSGIAMKFGIPWLSYGVVLLIAIALIASINATILGGGRVAYALAQDGCFWKGAGRLHPKWNTPRNALWTQAILASLIVLIFPWELIFSTISLVMVGGGTLTVLALYLLRWKQTDLPRSYKAMGYPIFPALFMVSGIGVIGVKLYDAWCGVDGSYYSVMGLAGVCLAYLSHRLWQSHLMQKIE